MIACEMHVSASFIWRSYVWHETLMYTYFTFPCSGPLLPHLLWFIDLRLFTVRGVLW